MIAPLREVAALLDRFEASGRDRPTRTRIFISYSRKDTAFARKLCTALLERGFEAYLDEKDVTVGEDWRARLDGLILNADAVVFVISPDSIARWDSPPPEASVCAWEIRRTVELKKQLLPVLWRALQGIRPPPDLGKPNWVSFEAYQRSSDEAAFAASLDGERGLLTALRVAEILWVREHTRWVARAAEWDKAEPERPDGKLLPTGELAAVEKWMGAKPMSAPEFPTVLLDYVLRSKIRIGRTFIGPAENALSAGLHDQALRLVAAGAILARNEYLGLVPDLWQIGVRCIMHGRLRVRIQADSSIHSAGFNRDGSRIIGASMDKIRIWCAVSGKELGATERTLTRGRVYPTGVFSDDEYATLWDERGLMLWRANSAYSKVAISANGNYVAALGEEGFEVAGILGGPRLVDDHFTVRRGFRDILAISDDGMLLVVVSDDGKYNLYDIKSGHGNRIKGRNVAFSPDRQRLVTVVGATARISDVQTGQELAELKGHNKPVAYAAFSPDGRRVVTGSDDTTARVWDTVTGEELLVLKGHNQGILTAVFSADGRRVLTASYDGTVRIWDVAVRLETAILRDSGRGQGFVFSRDGRNAFMYRSHREGERHIWDLDTGTQSRRPAEFPSVPSLHERRWSELSGASARILANTAKRDLLVPDAHEERSTGRLRDVETGKELARLKGHERDIIDADFSPDGRLVVTASMDHTARVWSAETGHEVLVLDGHTDDVLHAAFTPDGQRVITGSKDDDARVWDVSRASVIGEERSVLLAAALANGLGRLDDAGTRDPLLEDAPPDLFEALNERSDRRDAVQRAIGALAMPRHLNCYLSPTQFAEKFAVTPLSENGEAKLPAPTSSVQAPSDSIAALSSGVSRYRWLSSWVTWTALVAALVCASLLGLVLTHGSLHHW